MTVTHNNAGQKTCALYRSSPHACSYLSDQTAQTLFLDPAIKVNETLYTRLSEIGFRRSGTLYYRPDCESCQACIPARVVTSGFSPRRSQKRIIRRNRDVTVDIAPCYFTKEIYALYEHYIANQHADGDMYPATEQQFRDFLCEENYSENYSAGINADDVNAEKHPSYFLCLRARGHLIAVAVMDQLNNGLTAAYTFYDTREKRRSLGRYCILLQISLVEALKLDYLYLGYWISQCQKMSYKTDFTPVELLIGGNWLHSTSTSCQPYINPEDVDTLIITADK